MSLQDAVAEVRREVEKEAERLVRLGVPLWDALIQARQRIELRRKFKPEQENMR